MPEGRISFASGEIATVSAIPGAGYAFDRWEGDASGSETPIEVSMDRGKEITAVFVELGVLEIAIAGRGRVMQSVVDEDGSGGSGSAVRLTAVPEPGCYFSGWTGDTAELDSTITVVLDGHNHDLTAHFPECSWTFMVYMDADNDLERYALDDLNELERADLGATGINVLALVDRSPRFDTSLGDWSDTRLYHIEYDATGSDELASRRIDSAELGRSAEGATELTMGDPAILGAFLETAKALYPASHYALVLWNHGEGWLRPFLRLTATGGDADGAYPSGGLSDAEPAGAADYGRLTGSGKEYGHDSLYTNELGVALSRHWVDVVCFDLCLASMVEVAYEIRGFAGIMVASEDVSPADGYEYDMLLGSLAASDLTPDSLARVVVSSYADAYGPTVGATIAAIDLGRMEGVVEALDVFSDALYLACDTAVERDQALAILYRGTEGYRSVPGDLNLDLYDAAERIAMGTDHADESALSLMDAVEGAIVAEWHNTTVGSRGNPRSHGLAIHFVHLDHRGDPDGHAGAYDPSRNSAYPLSFVDQSSWCPDRSRRTGLLYRLWYEDLP